MTKEDPIRSADRLVGRFREAVTDALSEGMSREAVISELDGVMALLHEQASAAHRTVPIRKA